MALFGYLCDPMKIKQIILALKISFLLTLFGAATFYFQYASVKKAYSISSSKNQTTEKNSGTLPIAEEETENEKTSAEEEEQDNDRVFYDFELITEISSKVSITLSTVHSLDFKEIHFEIVTPPPQA